MIWVRQNKDLINKQLIGFIVLSRFVEANVLCSFSANVHALSVKA